MYATFGRLDKAELALNRGLNIVYGKNESGKSTWSAFIRAMLYGISTREKARAGHIPDKEKYLPWSGRPMYGRMELESADKPITLERRAGKNGVLSAATSTYDITGAPAEVGADLVGAAHEVYERTAFIGQAQLRVDRDGEIERRILAIAGSGEEDVSFGEIRDRLQSKKRTILSVRDSGELPRVQAEIDQIKLRLSEADEISETLKAQNARMANFSESLKTTQRAIAIKTAAQNAERKLFIQSAADELSQKRAEADKLRDGPGRETLDALSSLIREKISIESDISKLSLSLSSAENEVKRLSEKTSGSTAFAGLSDSEASLRAESDIQLIRAPSKKGSGFLSLISLFFALCFTASAAVISGTAVRIICIAVSAFLFVLSAFIFTNSRKGRKNSADSHLLELYGAVSEDAILSHLGEYLTLLQELQEAKMEAKSASELLPAAKACADALSQKINSILTDVGIEALSPEEGERKLSELVMARDAALRAEADAKIRVDAIAKTTASETAADIEYDDGEIPAEPLDVLQAQYDELARRRRECELSLAALKPRYAAIDRAECEKKLALLQERHSVLTLSYEALNLAIDELSLAEGELRRRFAPEVSRRASELFFELTGGSFEIVRILNSDFDMDVSESSAAAPRDILQLSRGTLDELYLSLRLALCELVLDGEKVPPMVLDDVFVNFDGERLSRALDLLKRLAEKRQIILFTCHEREAQYFANDPDVGIIKL